MVVAIFNDTIENMLLLRSVRKIRNHLVCECVCQGYTIGNTNSVWENDFEVVMKTVI